MVRVKELCFSNERRCGSQMGGTCGRMQLFRFKSTNLTGRTLHRRSESFRMITKVRVSFLRVWRFSFCFALSSDSIRFPGNLCGLWEPGLQWQSTWARTVRLWWPPIRKWWMPRQTRTGKLVLLKAKATRPSCFLQFSSVNFVLLGLCLPMKATVTTFDWQRQEVRAHDDLWIYIAVMYNRKNKYLILLHHWVSTLSETG